MPLPDCEGRNPGATPHHTQLARVARNAEAAASSKISHASQMAACTALTNETCSSMLRVLKVP
jgi:hypothetical protein